MPPRSANRKVVAVKSKKLTPKSKQGFAAKETSVSQVVDLSTPANVTKDLDSSTIEATEATNVNIVTDDVNIVTEVKEGVVAEEKSTDNVMEDISNMNEKGDFANEEKDVKDQGGDQNDENGDVSQMDTQGAEENSVEEAPKSHLGDSKALEDQDQDDIHEVKEDGDGEGDESGDDEEDSDPDEESLEFIQDSLHNRKKEKDIEIYVGGLDKGAVEEDLIKVFGKYGEVQTARIVKNSTTKKSKGFAFIRYASVDQAKNALSELKDGIEVKGKQVRISASQDNDTLYMGNICKTWTKEKVLEALQGFGIEQIEEVYLPVDPKDEGKIKGFALLEFKSHSDAMTAFQRLRKADAVFGRDRSAKVAFAQTPMHPSEEVLSKVKTVYVEGLTDSWDEEKVKEICKQYGEIENVKLSRSLKTKRKDFGFITFTSRESALACMEGINSAQIGEGDVKVTANIAKPQFRGRLQKGTRGGFKVKESGTGEVGTLKKKGQESGKKDQAVLMKKKGDAKSKGIEKEKAGPSKKKGNPKSKLIEKKGKALAKEKGKILPKSSGKEDKPNKSRNGVTEGQRSGASSRPERLDRKRKNLPPKVEGRGKRDMDHGYANRPLKKARGGRQSDTFRNPQRSNPHFREAPVYVADPVPYRNRYASDYVVSSSSYPSRPSLSGSKRGHPDMEPHAGLLEPAAVQHGRSFAGYVEPALGSQGRLRAGFYESAVGNQTYDYGLRRVGGYDGQGIRGSAYVGGSAIPPSYVPGSTTYAGYQGGTSGADYYYSSRAGSGAGSYLSRRTYY